MKLAYLFSRPRWPEGSQEFPAEVGTWDKGTQQVKEI